MNLHPRSCDTRLDFKTRQSNISLSMQKISINGLDCDRRKQKNSIVCYSNVTYINLLFLDMFNLSRNDISPVPA
ncbi:CLUMA_CG000306, isoform A [Clunio marinus]|uniref:CLUMA_CG000306, isoform A n=1 Tax=Clunio marinus TaxID=568069 RepID=A0A1J1HEW0_9DIPT|nr:CLUMA_CG000306, isoform A [Clunio marinus]